MESSLHEAKFPLGKVVTTPQALAAIINSGQLPMDFVSRHAKGDWGDLCQDDKEANNQAIENGERILSAYRTLNGIKLWIISEADRTSTCILVPEEY